MTRVFIALELPKEVKDEIIKFQEILRKKNFFNGKFTERENLHLTLKFLGEISEEKINVLREKLREIKLNSFEAKLLEVGVFSKDFVKIVWVKLGGDGVFGLQKEIDNKLKDIFDKEERFMSHITILRVKSVQDKKGLIEFLGKIKCAGGVFQVKEFFLKKSELFPEGPVYTDIEKYTLVNKK